MANAAELPAPPEPDNLALIYDKAQDSAEHHDSLLWEVTAIIWGASALLLGFIIETLGKDATTGQRIAVCSVAILGILVTWVAQRIMKVDNKIMNVKYEICRELEGRLLEEQHQQYRQHVRIEQLFEQEGWKGKQKRLHLWVALIFTAVWVVVILVSAWPWICAICQRFK